VVRLINELFVGNLWLFLFPEAGCRPGLGIKTK